MFSKPEPNTNWTLKTCKRLETTYKTTKRTETDVQNFPPRSAILASLFARPNDLELAFQVWKSSWLFRPGLLSLVTLSAAKVTKKRERFLSKNKTYFWMSRTIVFVCDNEFKFNVFQFAANAGKMAGRVLYCRRDLRFWSYLLLVFRQW